jgi:hypothetical protein
MSDRLRRLGRGRQMFDVLRLHGRLESVEGPTAGDGPIVWG